MKTLQWHYQLHGQRIGGVSALEIDDLVCRGVIGHATNVWTEGMSTWMPLRSTSLAAIVSVPPPLIAVNNTLIWWLAFMPIIGCLVEFGAATAFRTTLVSVWWITVILNSVVAIWDDVVVRKAGHRVGAFWALFLVPVYVFRRSAVVDHNYGYSIMWVVSFLVSIVLGGVFAVALLHPNLAY
jgi:hypothetical protein